MISQHDKFVQESEAELNRIIELFKKKNKSYGANNDLFHNFRQTAVRLFGDDSCDSMFKVAEVYKDKHQVALAKGIKVPECEERLRDNIVYSLIQMAMIREMKAECNEV